MAPDPHAKESSTTGPVISGHKISLNVHYNDETDSTSCKLPGAVTPLEEMVANTGAYNLPAIENQDKFTHVDRVKLSTEESEHLSTHSSEQVRPASPGTCSLHSESDVEKASSSPAQSSDCEDYNMAPTKYLSGPDQIIPTKKFKAWKPADTVRLKIGDRGISSYTPVSVPTLLQSRAEEYPDNPALAVKEDGKWNFVSYSEYLNTVRTVAKAFIKLGLERFHGVCILGFNSPEWFYSNLASIFAGGACAGIYTTNSAEACQHCAKNCKAQIWVVENQKQLEKVLQIRQNLPHLRAIIQYTGKPIAEGVLSWDEVLKIGQMESDEALEERLRCMAINQLCTLIYTSGTTGAPKGVMLSHDNMTWTTHANIANVKAQFGKERFISYLPLSHVAAQLVELYCPIYTAGTVYFAQPDALKGTLGQTLKEVHPTIFFGVPRVWEKIQEKMLEVGRKTKGVKRSIANWAKALGLDVHQRKQLQDYSKPIGYALARAIVYKKVKEALGLDSCRIFLSGAAPLAPDVLNYFQSLDICLTEIYGMSESSGPHTIGLENAFRNGSVGQTVPGCYSKIDNPDKEGNGEICMGGRNVCMGYMHQEDKTNETIDEDGWLHSGDIGRLDSGGYLFITGRLKELLITAGGENIPPVLIEDHLKGELPCLSNAMLIGDRRKFLSILLTFKTLMDDDGAPLDALAPTTIDWCRSVGSTARTVQEILSGPDAAIMSAIQAGIDRTNKNSTSNAQKIQKWTILPLDFSIPGEELGPTLKLKRPVVLKKYNATIEKFYS